MTNMLIFVCLSFLLALQLETPSGKEFGSCVETCSINPENPNGFGACAEGYVCTSTGCGHTCQLAAPGKKDKMGACVEMCSPSPNILDLPECAEGYQCRFNGCGHTCQLDTEVAKRQRCAPVLCRIYCPNGFLLDDDQCEICQCQE